MVTKKNIILIVAVAFSGVCYGQDQIIIDSTRYVASWQTYNHDLLDKTNINDYMQIADRHIYHYYNTNPDILDKKLFKKLEKKYKKFTAWNEKNNFPFSSSYDTINKITLKQYLKDSGYEIDSRWSAYLIELEYIQVYVVGSFKYTSNFSNIDFFEIIELYITDSINGDFLTSEMFYGDFQDNIEFISQFNMPYDWTGGCWPYLFLASFI